MPAVVCYGDSNTWGYRPTGDGRFGPEERWPGVVRYGLGDACQVHEEGLNSRTTRHELRDKPHRSGAEWLPLALETHAPVDWLVLALGTNDLFVDPPLTADDAANGVAELVALARASGFGPQDGAPRVVVLSPPPYATLLPEWRLDSPHGEAESRRFPACFAAMAEATGVPCLALDRLVASSPLDGVHFDAAAHRTIGAHVAALLRETPA